MKHLNMRIVSLKSHWKPLSFDFSRIICRVRSDSTWTGITEQGLWSHVPGADLCAKEGRVCIHAVKQCSGASAWLKHSWWGAAKPGMGWVPHIPTAFPGGGCSLCCVVHRCGCSQPSTTTLVLLLNLLGCSDSCLFHAEEQPRNLNTGLLPWVDLQTIFVTLLWVHDREVLYDRTSCIIARSHMMADGRILFSYEFVKVNKKAQLIPT